MQCRLGEFLSLVVSSSPDARCGISNNAENPGLKLADPGEMTDEMIYQTFTEICECT